MTFAAREARKQVLDHLDGVRVLVEAFDITYWDRTYKIVELRERMEALEEVIERVIEAPSWVLRRKIADKFLNPEGADEPD
jgi:hypothetical protein